MDLNASDARGETSSVKSVMINTTTTNLSNPFLGFLMLTFRDPGERVDACCPAIRLCAMVMNRVQIN